MNAAVPLLLVEDDRPLCELLREYLRAMGFRLQFAHDAESGVRQALDGHYSAVILDIMLPGGDGFEVLRRIRARSTLPVLMLTARGEEVDRIVGLELGADDYLPKPFNPRELAARLHAILRRASNGSRDDPATTVSDRIEIGDVWLDTRARIVVCSDHAVSLTGTEFALLEVLLRSAGRVVHRQELAKTVLGRRLEVFDRSIDMHVSNVRKKLGPGPAGEERIRCVRSTGYVYATPAPESFSMAL